MKEKTYCVYKHTNKLNNKVYIGSTSLKPEYRWNHGRGYCTQPYFWEEIQKYGWDNFTHEIMCDGLNKEEALAKEKELISYYNSENPEKGYNKIGALHQVKAESKQGVRRAVYCVELTTTFNNATQAAKELGLNNSHISAACKGSRKTCGGYHWRFAEVS